MSGAEHACNDLTARDDAALTAYRREHVGLVFQLYNLIPSLTARENVALVTEISAQPMQPEAALDLVGPSDRLDHFPAEPSGGEQQRVATARAIAKRPDVLLCEEPTGALDSKTGVRVLEALASVKESYAKAHGFGVGSRFHATLNGRKRALTIVGLALSPEYVDAIGPGDPMSDDRRFAVVAMSEKALAAKFGLDGAFNMVSVKLLRGADGVAVADRGRN